MTGPRACPLCATPLPPDAPHGLCPRCLLGVALNPTGEPERTGPPGTAFTAPEPAELAPLFPQLEILDLIGQGGMGAVYKARQVSLDRLVALKILSPRADDDPEFAERFAREARALARLSNPHIVAVYDSGRAGGRYYLLMEYVDGPNLRRVMAAGAVRPDEALRIVPQLCDALQYAHEEGVVHRDVKPENVLLDRKGRVKVADFGLAKLLGAAAGSTLTGTGKVMGTWHYMAPEQMERPGSVDHRADIYALGVVFYELLTGELPLGRFLPPSARVAVDARLDGIVLRTLEKEPERRYQQAGEVKTDVEAAGAARPAPAFATRRGPTPMLLRPMFWALAASVAAAAACFLPWSLFTLVPNAGYLVYSPHPDFRFTFSAEVGDAQTWGLAAWQGVATLAAAGSLSFLLALGGLGPVAVRWHPPVVAAAGLAILVFAALFVRSPPVPPPSEWILYSGNYHPEEGTFDRNGVWDEPEFHDVAGQQFGNRVRVQPRVGAYLSGGLGVILLMLGTAPLLRASHAGRTPSPAPATDPARRGDPTTPALTPTSVQTTQSVPATGRFPSVRARAPAARDRPRWNTTLPAVLAASAAVACCFLPWAEFRLQGFVADEVAVTTGESQWAYVRVRPSPVSGFRSPYGVAVILASAGLVYALLATGALRSPTRWHGWGTILTGAAVAGMAGLYLFQLPQAADSDFDLWDTGTTNLGRTLIRKESRKGPVENVRLRQQTAEQYRYAMQTFPRTGVYATLGLGVVLLLLGAPSLRSAATPRAEPTAAHAGEFALQSSPGNDFVINEAFLRKEP